VIHRALLVTGTSFTLVVESVRPASRAGDGVTASDVDVGVDPEWPAPEDMLTGDIIAPAASRLSSMDIRKSATTGSRDLASGVSVDSPNSSLDGFSDSASTDSYLAELPGREAWNVCSDRVADEDDSTAVCGRRPRLFKRETMSLDREVAESVRLACLRACVRACVRVAHAMRS
jgi:hypothetical protein